MKYSIHREWFFAIALTTGLIGLNGCSSNRVAAPSESEPIAAVQDTGTDSIPSNPNAAAQATAPAADAPALPPAPMGETPAPVTPPPAPEAANGVPPSLPAPAPAPSEQASAPKASGDDSGATQDYTVRSGDTLMKIAFENYGDLYRWKDIYEANKAKISNPSALAAGTVLKLEKTGAPAIDRNGQSYLIREGQTLGTISDDVYGMTSKWKRLWENNRQLIKNPNRIFAGFFLYYTFTSQDQADKDAAHKNKLAPVASADAPSSSDAPTVSGPSPAGMPSASGNVAAGPGAPASP